MSTDPENDRARASAEFRCFVLFYDKRFRKAAGRSACFRGALGEGDDIYQEAAERAWRRWKVTDGWDEQRRVAWMCTIIHNVAAEHGRAQVPHSELCEPADDIFLGRSTDPRSGPYADPTAQRARARILLDRLPLVLEKLTPEQRIAWESHMLGFSDKEIAVRIGRMPSTARSVLAGARARIAAELDLECAPSQLAHPSPPASRRRGGGHP